MLPPTPSHRPPRAGPLRRVALAGLRRLTVLAVLASVCLLVVAAGRGGARLAGSGPEVTAAGGLSAPRLHGGAAGPDRLVPASGVLARAAARRTNPVTQIRWGLRYIASVYGTPCGAWAHSRASNWY